MAIYNSLNKGDFKMSRILSNKKIRKNTLNKPLINKKGIVSHEDSTSQWTATRIK